MNTSPHLIFQSRAFPPVEGEDDEVNPGIFGKALAEWLASELPARGYEIAGMIPEDFGRLIQVKSPRCTLNIAVSSTDESATEWRVHVFVGGGLLARIAGNGPELAVSRDRLFEALQSIVQSHPGVADIKTERP